MAKKILLADDSLTIQKVVELTFSDSDFDLVCVSNGQKALEKVREDRPDLIMADVVMPEKNGYEVCEEIKSNPVTSRIPVVLLSGTFEPFDRQRAERIGCDAIVSKPFDSQQLIAQVEALLARGPGESSTDSASAFAASESSPPGSSEEERGPFEIGFAAEDFTGSLRLSLTEEKSDLFEEEFGRGDVDSAILAFERSQPESSSAPAGIGERSAGWKPSPEAPWLLEEPESSPVRSGAGSFAAAHSGWEEEERPEHLTDSETTGPIEIPFEQGISETTGPVSLQTDQVPAGESPHEAGGSRRPSSVEQPESQGEQPAASAFSESFRFDRAPREISEYGAEILFDIPSSEPQSSREDTPAEELSVNESLPPLAVSEGESASEESGEEETATPARESETSSGELEALAQTASIPELNTMLSSLMRSEGPLSEEDIDRLAKRVVEKLSDRVVREIAWEVIPDMAEIVIKQRIKELETGIE